MKKLRFLLCLLLTVIVAAVTLSGCGRTPEYVPPELSPEAILARDNALSLVKWYKAKNGIAETANPLSGKIVENVSPDFDWYTIGLRAIGADADYAAYKKALDSYIDGKAAEEKPFDKMQATDFQRLSLAYHAAGGDPNYAGTSKTNILAKATDINAAKAQGVNGLSYGLIALNMAGKTTNETASEFIKSILAYQNPSNGFSWGYDGNVTCEADLTGIVIIALAPYYNDEISYTYESLFIKENETPKTITKTVKAAIDEMFLSIKPQLNSEGNIEGTYGANPSSTATVIMAMSSVGKDVYKDVDYAKKDGDKVVTLFDGLAKFKTTDGGYRYTYMDETVEADYFSAKDAFLAFASYYKFSSPFSNLRPVASVSIDCKNILSNMSQLGEGYKKYVPENGILIDNAFVEVNGSNSAEKVIKEACAARDIKLDVSGGYISGINNLTEKCCGNSSGWLFKVNDKLATVGASMAKVIGGDTLSFHFTVTNGDVKNV